jgi:hypothetical protein
MKKTILNTIVILATIFCLFAIIPKTTNAGALQNYFDMGKNPNLSSTSYSALAPIPGVTDSKTVSNLTTGGLTAFLKNSFNLVVALAGLAAVLMIVYGGFLYATTDAILGKQNGAKIIKGAFWGLGLALVSWLLLNTLNPNLLKLDITKIPSMGNNNAQLNKLQNGFGVNKIVDRINQERWVELEQLNKGISVDEANLTAKKTELEKIYALKGQESLDAIPRMRQLVAETDELERKVASAKLQSTLSSAAVISQKTIEYQMVSSPDSKFKVVDDGMGGQKYAIAIQTEQYSGNQGMVPAKEFVELDTTIKTKIDTVVQRKIETGTNYINGLNITPEERSAAISNLKQQAEVSGLIAETPYRDAIYEKKPDAEQTNYYYSQQNKLDVAIKQNSNNPDLVKQLTATKEQSTKIYNSRSK